MASTIQRGEDDEETAPSPSDSTYLEVFKNVMGERGGWNKGIGPKPSSKANVSFEQSPPQPTFQLSQVSRYI